jgi:exonuclease SbcC
MIPVRLTLRNFLSYGEACPPVEFDGIHVACLSGSNGHGKSALLDAITWSLWGQARTNTADDLVRIGAQSMQVEFEFLLDGQTYRVTRKRTRGKNSQSDLQFQIAQADGTWRALTGQGVRGTQERIVQTLRMDYETFINSAFLLQGRADEFTRKTAGDRKRILGEILSLGLYDELCDAARIQAREAGMQVQHLEAEIGRLERELARRPELERQAEQFTVRHTEAQLATERLRTEQTAILLEKSQLDARRREAADLDRRLAAAGAEMAALGSQLDACRRRIDDGKRTLARAAEIRADAQELHALEQERDAMAARVKELRELEAEQHLLQRRLREEEHRLETKLQLQRQRVRELTALVDQLPRCVEQLSDLEKQIAALDRLHDERNALQARLPELAGEIAAAEADQKRAAEDLERAQERFDLLKAASAVCPLCEGELPSEKRLELGRRLREEKTALKEAQGRALQLAGDGRRESEQVRKRLQELEVKLRTGQAMRDRLAQVKNEHLRVSTAGQELPRELALAEEIEARLRQGDFAPEERQRLAELVDRIKALDYRQDHYERIASRITQLRGADSALESLHRVEAELPGEEARAADLDQTLKAREAALADDRAARAEAAKALARAPEVDAAALRIAAQLSEAERTEAAVGQQLGAAREALQRCAELQPQIADRKKASAEAARQQAAYEELARAFGRNGIQALIIENALPEVEAETNLLLARMTGGELSVSLRTQRELRSGGQAETLEIEISDGVGPRRYELYSGGEAFRVNFALRIALSKLLARRAGARLETLVVDEGFGSQDQQGREAMIEAIQAIQDDFAKVLVITHLDELKEVFPSRIEVTKGPLGSQVAVM